MAKLALKVGATSQRIFVFIQDSSVTTGVGKAGLVFNTSGIKWYVAREDDGNAGGVAYTPATATLGTWTSIGFKEKDATNMPGIYELGIPNAALAAGSKFATMMISGMTNAAPCLVEIELVAYDPFDAVHLGLSSLPNAAANAAGGLPISAAGALDLDEMNADIEAIQTSTAGLTFTVANQVDSNPITRTGFSLAAGGLTGTSYVPPTTALTESYAALHAAPTEAQLLFEIRALLAEKSVASTTLTAKKIDGSTTAATFTLNDATTPTAITRAS